jgi:predicted dehydrogenase
LREAVDGGPVRVLIIGAGKMGRAHAVALRTIPDVHIVGVASRSGTRAARLAAEYGIPRAGNDWEALTDATRPDACVVAVSHALNEAVTAAVIDRGLHVLAEKPVAFSSEGVRTLAARAEERGVIAMAAMNRRYFRSVLAAIETVRYHGRVLGVTAFAPDPVRPFRAQHRYDAFVYDNWLLANTLHLIDLLRLAVGEVASLDGAAALDELTGEASVVATLRFEGGALGGFVRYPSAARPWELRIHGQDVEARLEPLEAGALRVGEGPVRPLPGGDDLPGVKLNTGLRPQALAFVHAIREVGRLTWPASDLADHARSVALAERIAALGAAGRVGPSALTSTP